MCGLFCLFLLEGGNFLFGVHLISLFFLLRVLEGRPIVAKESKETSGQSR